jgi:hypothetical protein
METGAGMRTRALEGGQGFRCVNQLESVERKNSVLWHFSKLSSRTSYTQG